MSRRTLLWLVYVVVAGGALWASPSTVVAQAGAPEMQGPGPVRGPLHLDPSTRRTYVPLGAARGFIYEPIAPGQKSHTGILVMHFDADYTAFSACTELSKRGYTVLCAANSREGLDNVLLDVQSAMTYLRSYPGVRKIVLWGHSGGATLMSAYQLVAENGTKACQGAEKLIKCSERLAGLPPADGMILADANWGNAEMALFSLDPAVRSDDDGMNVNPALDLFSPKNGYDPAGAHYSPEFIRKYQRAAGEREMELIRKALQRLSVIEAGHGHFADDEPFLIAGGASSVPNNKLFAEDTRLMSHTQQAWPLLHADGSVTHEIIRSVRTPEGRGQTAMLGEGAINTTVRSFLKNNAVRVSSDYGFDEDSVHGIDWTSTYASPPGNVERIHVPLLVMGMTGHWEYLASETIYAHAASTDKSLAFVEGASHMYDTCKPCEKTPGQYGDTIKTLYDYADQWLAQPGRF